MIVEEIMNTDVVTLTKDDSISEAIRLMTKNKIRHIPIINSINQLIGLVTDRDIKEATPSTLQCCEQSEVLEQPLATIMKTELITGHPLDFVEEAAAVFYENKIGCLPIINNNKLAGIITATDILHTLVELTGAHQPGSQIEIRVPNKPGQLVEVASCIMQRKVNVLSVLLYPDKKDENYKIIVVRVQTINPIGLIEDLKRNGHHVLWPNLPGILS